MTVYYIDNNRGSDSNDGLSMLRPWQNLAKITSTTGALAGDAFLLADDSFWQLSPAQRVVPANTWNGTEAAPVIIGKYSPVSQSINQRPLISMNVNTTTGDWVWDGVNLRWVYTYPTAHINRAVLLRIADSWIANTYDYPIANTSPEAVDGRYNIGSGLQTVFLYSPPGVNPVDYYGKIVVSAQALGAITLSTARKWITVQDIAFRETGCGVLCYSQDANPANFVVQRCRSDIGCLAVVGGASPGANRSIIRNNEVYDFGAIGIHVTAAGGAGIADVEIYGNKIDGGVRQWAQAGIYLQVRNAARESICFVYNNEIARCRWGTKDKSLDGCAIYAETGTDGAVISGNRIHDCYVAMQDNSGRRVFWTGNTVYDCRRGIRVTDQNLNGLSDCRLYNNTFLVGDQSQNATEFGNTTQGADYPAVWAYSVVHPINITAKNNVFVNEEAQRGRAVFGLAGIASTYDITNNWVYGFEADTLDGSSNAAAAVTVSNAGVTDPRPFMAHDGRLIAPYYVGAGVPAKNPLGGAGVPIPAVRLQGGRRIDPNRVPVGAFDERGA